MAIDTITTVVDRTSLTGHRVTRNAMPGHSSLYNRRDGDSLLLVQETGLCAGLDQEIPTQQQHTRAGTEMVVWTPDSGQSKGCRSPLAAAITGEVLPQGS